MPSIGPLKRPETLKDLAYDQIRGLLTGGKIAGASLITATQFAEMLHVSRTPIREALLQLASEGFLVAIDGRGFKIKEFSEKEIRDFFETRRIIESHVVGRLVGSLTETDFLMLDETLRFMEAQADNPDPFPFLDADKDFHLGLVHRHGNQLLESITVKIRTLISILGRKALYQSGRAHSVVEEHRRILQALKQGQAKEAVQAMNHHLDVTEHHILARLKQ